MTITSEALKHALSPITSIAKRDTVSVDMAKVATALIEETHAFVSAENPLAGLDDLCKRVEGIEGLLGQANMDQAGNVFATVPQGDAIAKEFSLPASPVVAATAVASPAVATAKVEGEETGEETVTEKGEETDLSDDIAWERDLGFAKPPLTRQERFTKGERPVPARPGAQATINKFEEARSRARDRREPGARTLS